MTDTYTPSLRAIQMATGSNNGVWGDKENKAVAALEQAIAGATSISLTGGDHTLTTADNAPDEARNMVIGFTGTPGVTRTVNVPDVSKLTLFINNTDSSIIFDAGAGLSAVALSNQIGFGLSDGGGNIYFFPIADLPGKGILPQVFSHASM